LARKNYELIDSRIEDICKAWDNPPPLSRLDWAVNHPMIRGLMPVVGKLRCWLHVSFLGAGDRLLGLTTYGKAYVWEVPSGKIITSFRVADTGLEEELERILGLDEDLTEGFCARWLLINT
ncbi:MAG: hypothetical protein RMJ19_07905, partial [Gemmatales bacterium]|nr:hypothetical protein [Gemmatales bacterium]MDW8175580.1 hypothetical protein [Gemmatales bacterium]